MPGVDLLAGVERQFNGGRRHLLGNQPAKTRLLICTQMIHGARTALGRAGGKQDPRGLWLGKLRTAPSQCGGGRARQQECEDRLVDALG